MVTLSFPAPRSQVENGVEVPAICVCGNAVPESIAADSRTPRENFATIDFKLIRHCVFTKTRSSPRGTAILPQPRSQSILNDIEFPANVYPFLNLKRHGVEVDFVKSRGGKILPEDIDAAMTDRTRLLSISHVQFLSGYRADLKLIGELCEKQGILFSVDAIQSAGVVPVDVQEMKIDFYEY